MAGPDRDEAAATFASEVGGLFDFLLGLRLDEEFGPGAVGARPGAVGVGGSGAEGDGVGGGGFLLYDGAD